MVSVHATGPKVRRLKTGRGGEFLMAIKIRSTFFFGGEVKQESPCNILMHVRNHSEVGLKIRRRKQFISFATSLLLLLDDSAGRIASCL
jgi:hypothetical protein